MSYSSTSLFGYMRAISLSIMACTQQVLDIYAVYLMACCVGTLSKYRVSSYISFIAAMEV